jgi:hypothetical protein
MAEEIPFGTNISLLSDNADQDYPDLNDEMVFQRVHQDGDSIVALSQIITSGVKNDNKYSGALSFKTRDPETGNNSLTEKMKLYSISSIDNGVEKIDRFVEITNNGKLIFSNNGGIKPYSNGISFYRNGNESAPDIVLEQYEIPEGSSCYSYHNRIVLGQNESSQLVVKSQAEILSTLKIAGEITAYNKSCFYKVGIGANPTIDEPGKPPNAYLVAKSGIINEWFEVRGDLHVGEFYGASDTSNPADLEIGAKLFFNGKAYNTDEIWMARYNEGNDKSALIINIGDNAKYPNNEDSLKIGAWVDENHDEKKLSYWQSSLECYTNGTVKIPQGRLEIGNWQMLATTNDFNLNKDGISKLRLTKEGKLIVNGGIEINGKLVEAKNTIEPAYTFDNKNIITESLLNDNYSDLHQRLMNLNGIKLNEDVYLKNRFTLIDKMKLDPKINSDGDYFIMFKMGGVQIRGKEIKYKKTTAYIENYVEKRKDVEEITTFSSINNSHAVFILVINGVVSSICWHEFSNTIGWSLRDVVLTCYRKIDKSEIGLINIEVMWCVFSQDTRYVQEEVKHCNQVFYQGGIRSETVVTVEGYNNIVELVGCLKNDRRELIILKA